MRIAYFNRTMKPGHDGVTSVLFRLADYEAVLAGFSGQRARKGIRAA
jgi:hypothetical protein